MNRLCLVALLLVIPAAVTAQTKDHAPEALPSADRMTHDNPKSESWTYRNPKAQFSKYKSLMIEPTTVYAGPDAQFDDVNVADRQKFAGVVTDALKSELAKSFPVVTSPGADTLRLRLTLLGVEGTKGGVATVTRVMPIGLALSALKSIEGKPGKFTGSILFAVEAFGGRSSELEFAAVRRRSPDALDIPATFSTSDTVKAVANDLAEAIRKKLEQAAGRAG